MTTSTKAERLAATLKAHNLDPALTAKLPEELKKRLSVKSIIWIIDLMDQLQDLTIIMESICDERTEQEANSVLIES